MTSASSQQKFALAWGLRPSVKYQYVFGITAAQERLNASICKIKGRGHSDSWFYNSAIGVNEFCKKRKISSLVDFEHEVSVATEVWDVTKTLASTGFQDSHPKWTKALDRLNLFWTDAMNIRFKYTWRWGGKTLVPSYLHKTYCFCWTWCEIENDDVLQPEILRSS